MEFPAGIAAGEGSDYNLLTLARNGKGEPVLRGTALAGALRHAWKRHLQRAGLSEDDAEDEVKNIFGYALGDEDLFGSEKKVDSLLQVNDCVLRAGAQQIIVRTHHLRNRHTGVVAHGGLFSLEACPPGTTTTAVLWLRDEGETADAALDLLRTIVGLLHGGITLGGKAARGIGLARLIGTATYRIYDLTNPETYGQWLDDHRAWRAAGTLPTGESLHPATGNSHSWLQVRFCLGIPRGQDVLIGDGQGLDHEMEPQRVQAADGREYWRLPGASLRGIFRAWFARLAARADQPVADKAERQQLVWTGELTRPEHERLDDDENYNGKNVGYCFLPKAERQPLTRQERRAGKRKTDCLVAALFGSLFESGRIHIADAYAPCSEMTRQDNGQPQGYAEEQPRMHVAVDRITGGAAESMLFDNTVLTAYADGRSPRFEVKMFVQQPAEQEARWLAETLRALDLGILRVGSSKSSGRLSLIQAPQAKGAHQDLFTAIEPAFPPQKFNVA
jgi:CRISPR/Cas system CSM-associated protein Csm3 (group 7 of RAMP superfamily)